MGVQQQILELRRQILALKTRLGQVVITGTTNPAAHAATHADAGSDPVNVTTLDGFPGGTTDFLRADGTFATPSAGSGITQLTGDVTAGPGSGSVAATIAADAVTNAKLADEAQATVKGRAAAAGTGNPTDLTANEVSTILDSATDPFLRTSAASAGIALGYYSIGIVLDGQGADITTGLKGYRRLPNKAMTLIGMSLMSIDTAGPHTSGSITVDIWNQTWATFPVVGQTIIGGGGTKPLLSTSSTYEDTSLTGITTSYSGKSIFGFNVDSCSGITKAILQLDFTYT